MEKIKLDFPNEPKIPLDNYLLKLVDKKDGIGSSLYLYGVEFFVKELWEEITESDKILKKDLLEKLQVQASPFCAIMKGKRGISIQQLYKLLTLWGKLCNKNDSELKKKWDGIYKNDFLIASFSKPIKVKLPKFITPKLAYIIGLIIGDGCFDCSSNKERIKINEKNREQLELIIKPITEELFGIKCYVRKDNPGPCLRIFSKSVYRFFRKVLGIKVGRIPKLIWTLDETNKSFLIRGLFDSEGDVDANYLRSKVRISQNSKQFLKNLLLLMKSIDISANGPYGPNFGSRNGVCYNIEVRKKSEILKFKQIIGTSHLEKNKKLEILTNEIKDKYTRFQNLGI